MHSVWHMYGVMPQQLCHGPYAAPALVSYTFGQQRYCFSQQDVFLMLRMLLLYAKMSKRACAYRGDERTQANSRKRKYVAIQKEYSILPKFCCKRAPPWSRQRDGIYDPLFYFHEKYHHAPSVCCIGIEAHEQGKSLYRDPCKKERYPRGYFSKSRSVREGIIEAGRDSGLLDGLN